MTDKQREQITEEVTRVMQSAISFCFQRRVGEISYPVKKAVKAIERIIDEKQLRQRIEKLEWLVTNGHTMSHVFDEEWIVFSRDSEELGFGKTMDEAIEMAMREATNEEMDSDGK